MPRRIRDDGYLYTHALEVDRHERHFCQAVSLRFGDLERFKIYIEARE